MLEYTEQFGPLLLMMMMMMVMGVITGRGSDVGIHWTVWSFVDDDDNDDGDGDGSNYWERLWCWNTLNSLVLCCWWW